MTKVFTILVLILLSACSLSPGAPIANSGPDVALPIVLYERQQQECTNIGGDRILRTTPGIVLSCLATMFACTWVAIHPNLPGPRDSEWTKLKRKVVTMICAIIGPEFMAFWALRQRLAAGRIAKKFNQKYGQDDSNGPSVWTLTHGFFVQMGAFLLYDGKTPKRVLTFKDLQKMIKKGQVKVPDITERDINGRSKGDFLTKLVVVLQTTWFVFQCIVRGVRNLPVTELEVVTLAFAALNLVTYALWWKKPQNVVDIAAYVQLECEVDRDGRGAEGGTESEELLIGGYKESCIVQRLEEATSDGLFGCLLGVPIVLLYALRHPLAKMATDDDEFVVRQSLRVPMFYADRFKREDLLPVMTISILFGAFHLIPWSSPFPSTTALRLWRASALFITLHPILAVASMLAYYFSYHRVRRAFKHAYNWTLPLYILARLVLLVLAFITLRHLPSDAYTDIERSSFIPHF